MPREKTHSPPTSFEGASPLPSDEDLIERVGFGQDHAFDLLVARYGGRLRAYLMHLVGDAAAAEDLCQDALVKVLRHANGRDPQTLFAVWLFRIARNLGLNHLRRRRIRRRAIEFLRRGQGGAADDRGRSPLGYAEDHEFEVQLEREIRRLPEEQRTAFLLREREAMSYEQIAVVAGTSPKTISTRIHRARLRLRHALRPWMEDPEEREDRVQGAATAPANPTAGQMAHGTARGPAHGTARETNS